MDCSVQYKNTCGYYRVEGRGNVVVLLHGFIEEGSMWDEPLKALRKKYKVIVPDLPGFGKSPLFQAPPLVQGRPGGVMDVYASYVKAILDQEKVKRCVLLGHSMGGYITLSFAEKYAEMLDGFGLINSHCFEDSPEKKKNRLKGIDFVRRNGPALFVTELYNNIFHESFKKKNRKLINGLIAKATRYSAEAVMSANAGMMNRKGKEEILQQATVPVLLVNGKQDDSAPLAYTLKQAAYPAIADVHFFDNCKHMCVFERKKETIQIMEDFCGRVFSR